LTQKTPDLESSWLEILQDEFEKPHMLALKAFLVEEKKQHTVYPKGKDIFNAFRLTPFEDVNVVILGQDPYHGPNQAHGLCFSVQRGIRPPPSLRNIYKELNEAFGIPIPSHGDLSHWARQGVLLLNTVLTVQARKAHSHKGKGWEQFTDRVIQELNARRTGLIFVLWGRPAQAKKAMIDTQRHLVLTAPHPSPFSASYGFFGCGHFQQINRHLETLGKTPVDWRLS